MATDLNRAIHQSFIFAFGQGSGEVAVGYFDRLRKGLKQMTKVLIYTTCSLTAHIFTQSHRLFAQTHKLLAPLLTLI
jgi:hypothetical protein